MVVMVVGATGCGDDAPSDDGSGGGASSGDGGAGGGASDGGSDGSGGDGGDATSTTSGTGTTASTTSTGQEQFTLEVSTALEGDSIALATNLPLQIDVCLGLPVAGLSCADDDVDGLVDAWEDVVLDRLRPLVILDEDEELVGAADFAVGLVGRVAPVGDRIHVFMMLGYAEDFGSCGFTAHHGDSERVALRLAPHGDTPGGVVVEAAYTAAHEGTENDHGRLFVGPDLAELTFGADPVLQEPRWAVFASANKHATYGSLAICEGVSNTPCLDEDCGPDGVDPADYALLFPFVNAGEESAPLATDLSMLGFPGDDAWAAQDFCGGLGGDGCSSPVRDKLLADPF